VSDIYGGYNWQDTHVYGHYTFVRNPARTFSVFEASAGGCQTGNQATVEEAAISRCSFTVFDLASMINYFFKCTNDFRDSLC